MRRSPAGLLFAALVAGCGPGPDGADSADAQVREWTLQQTVRIGSVDDAEQALTRVLHVLFGPDGEIVIPQPEDHTVRVFDSTGRPLTDVGRRGQGPGEFGSVSTAGFTGDTLWVGDDGLGRLTFFDLDGRLLRTMPWTPAQQRFDGGLYRIGVPSVLLHDGTGIIEVGMLMRMTRGAGPTALPPPLPYVRTDSATSTVDSLALRDMGQRERTLVTAGGREISLFWSVDDSPAYAIAADGGGIVIVDRFRAPDANASEFTVRRIDAEGDTVFSRDYPYRPIPTSEAVTDRVVAELAERLDRGEGVLTADRVERELRAAGLIPATLEPVSEVATGTDATIWLKLASASEEVATWLVLDRSGEPVGRVELPAGQSVLAVEEGRIAVLELDELDVPYVVVYRLVR
jgi:hypothetical protein